MSGLIIFASCRTQPQITTDLSGLCVASLLDLAQPLLGERDAEDAEHVTVGCLDFDVSLNQRLPLANERPKLVSGEVHALLRDDQVAKESRLFCPPY